MGHQDICRRGEQTKSLCRSVTGPHGRWVGVYAASKGARGGKRTSADGTRHTSLEKSQRCVPVRRLDKRAGKKTRLGHRSARTRKAF